MNKEAHQKIIDQGRGFIDLVLEPHGFTYEVLDCGNSSGGYFTQAAFTRPDRRLTFSYRWAIGCAVYHCQGESTSHEALMEYLGVDRQSAYVWFDRSDPMSGFQSLAKDISAYLQSFLTGSADDFTKLIRECMENRKPNG
ncbi:hypothetical protein Mal64_25310 [Pseudobythopirellula maris]|uniref:Uncharacterized protein n=1 Tax=Pseudobythopirellula maris TaxID=2527991 RepID=A0A5C5ZPA2_9BACT|nr:hypothetical protein [Pseudobythopirellula maris]TWT89040.1 hypothetical protein Mal64_25310 [Pseudobythopirellula maris]